MKEKGKSFINEFKDFAMKGNVIDLAVGVIIGGSFNKIVSSLVEHVIMPIIGLFTGGISFENLEYTLRAQVGETPALVLKYGLFIQNVVDFLIIAFSVFVMIKVISKLNRKKEDAIAKEEVKEEVKEEIPTKEEILLTEIRDLLKEKISS